MKDYCFGNYVCALRRRLGLSQFQLGALTGVTDKAVSKWENGDAKPKIATCFRLAEVLGVSVDELLSCKQHPVTTARKEPDKMNRKLWKEAYERLSIFGENPPAVCWCRLAAEEAALQETDAIQSFAVLRNIGEAAKKNGALFFAAGTISSSFAAWLFGATKVNPLPAHYRCPKCGETEFVPGAATGFDLPPKKCTCGENLLRDGHNVPFEGYAKIERSATCVDLRVSERFKPIAAQTIKAFYKEKAELLPVKPMADGHPIGTEKYVVLREQRTEPTLSEDGFWHVEAGGFWHWRKCETTFSLTVDHRLDQIQALQEQTKMQPPDPLELLTPEMMETLYQKRCGRLAFITEKLSANEPHDFDLLVRLDGFCYASGAWIENGEGERCCSNGEKIVSEGRAAFREIPALREDIWNDVSNALACSGIRDNGLALKTMEAARKGVYCFRGMPAHIENLLLSLGLPEWYPEYLKKVMYLFPKGHCISLLLVDMVYEWYCELAGRRDRAKYKQLTASPAYKNENGFA